MRRPPSGLVVPGMIVARANRVLTQMTWPNGSISNLTFDDIQYDPLGMFSGDGTFTVWRFRLPGRYAAVLSLTGSFTNAVGSRWFRHNHAGSVSGTAYLAALNGLVSNASVGPSGRRSVGAAGQIEIFQDSGVEQAVSEAGLIISYLGDR